MKRIGLLIMMLMMICGVCSAKDANWEYIGHNTTTREGRVFDEQLWIDTNSVRVVKDGDKEIIKAVIKDIMNNNDSYNLKYMKVDRDSKIRNYYHNEVYQSGKLTMVMDDIGIHLYSSDDIITNAILKKANI